MAERGGFEPPVRFYSYNGLANRRFRPLSHLSALRWNQSGFLPVESGIDWALVKAKCGACDATVFLCSECLGWSVVKAVEAANRFRWPVKERLGRGWRVGEGVVECLRDEDWRSNVGRRWSGTGFQAAVLGG